ncbi:MAG: DUF3135 domain-containing protein [Burkholderiales bacterium]
MNPGNPQDFDFESWSELARNDADEFERRRREMIDAFLATAPEHLRQRLHGLQFRIDLERQRAGTPLGAAVRLNSMMWSSFMELRDALSGMSGETAALPQAAKATLIQFPERS